MAGALLVSPWMRNLGLGKLVSNGLALVGISMIVLSVVLLDDQSPYPGWRAIIPVAGSMLLIMSSPALINRYMLSSRPFVAIGLVSYPLYLWHWPLLCYAGMLAGGELTVWHLATVISLSLLLAVLTYRFVERPFRSGILVRWKVVGLSSAMAAIALLGFATVAGSIPQRIPQSERTRLSFSPG